MTELLFDSDRLREAMEALERLYPEPVFDLESEIGKLSDAGQDYAQKRMPIK